MTALLLNVIAFIIRRRWLLTQRLECAHATIMVQEPVFTSLYISHSGVSIEIRAAVDQTEDKIVWSKMTASKKIIKIITKQQILFVWFLFIFCHMCHGKKVFTGLGDPVGGKKYPSLFSSLHL